MGFTVGDTAEVTARFRRAKMIGDRQRSGSHGVLKTHVSRFLEKYFPHTMFNFLRKIVVNRLNMAGDVSS